MWGKNSGNAENQRRERERQEKQDKKDERESRHNQREKNDNTLDGFCRNAGVGGNESGRKWNDSK